jgi:hypothetical protein
MDKKFKQKGFAVRVKVSIDGDQKLVRLSGPLVWAFVLYLLGGLGASVAILSAFL